jgi:hypothetical protein
MSSEADAFDDVPIRFPVRVPVDNQRFAEYGLPAAVCSFACSPRGSTVPVFTSIEAAQMFPTNEAKGKSLLLIGTPAVLAAILDDCTRRGVDLIGVDIHYPPGTDTFAGHFVLIRDVIQAVFGKNG